MAGPIGFESLSLVESSDDRLRRLSDGEYDRDRDRSLLGDISQIFFSISSLNTDKYVNYVIEENVTKLLSQELWNFLYRRKFTTEP